MKEIKETIEKVIGYEAFDGTTFLNESECKEYEGKAVNVAYKHFKELFVNKTTEYYLVGDIFYGPEYHDFAVVEIKSKEDIKTIELYAQFTAAKDFTVDEKYIGKKILLSLGNNDDSHEWRHLRNYGTIDEVINRISEPFTTFFEQTED